MHTKLVFSIIIMCCKKYKMFKKQEEKKKNVITVSCKAEKEKPEEPEIKLPTFTELANTH